MGLAEVREGRVYRWEEEGARPKLPGAVAEPEKEEASGEVGAAAGQYLVVIKPREVQV